MITTVLGMRGHGKSTWIMQHIFSFPRLIIYDTLAEYDIIDNFQTLIDLFDYLKTHSDDFFHLNYIPFDPEREFEQFCEFCYELYDVAIVVEEIDMFSHAGWSTKFLNYIIRYGRHKNIDFISTSRRPADIPRMITSQTEKFIIFRIIEPRDITFLSMITGHDLDFKSLKKFEYFEIQQDKVEKKFLKKP